MPIEVVLASANQGKLREFNRILAPADFNVRPQSDFDIESVEETGTTFVENAILKARHAAAIAKRSAIADDSGIEVDALDGQPGIYSARFSGPDANDAANNALLLEKMRDVPDEARTARYQCILVYMRHEADPTPLIVQCAWEGIIMREERGQGGFGYDPLFWVPTHECSAAELDRDVKNSISHRGRAMELLLRELKGK